MATSTFPVLPRSMEESLQSMMMAVEQMLSLVQKQKAELRKAWQEVKLDQKDVGGTLPSIPEQPIIIQEGGHSQEKEDLAIQESGGSSLLTQEVQEKALEDQESCGSFQEESFDKQEDRQASRICGDFDCKETLLLKQHGHTDFIFQELDECLGFSFEENSSSLLLQLGLKRSEYISHRMLQNWLSFFQCSPTQSLLHTWFKGELIKMLFGSGLDLLLLFVPATNK